VAAFSISLDGFGAGIGAPGMAMRAPLEMESGTTFYFVTDGLESALSRAKEAAGARTFALGAACDSEVNLSE
jgi:hypothetical protein